MLRRLINSRTGVVVRVDDDTASRLDGDWKPVEKKAPAKKAASSKSEK